MDSIFTQGNKVNTHSYPLPFLPLLLPSPKLCSHKHIMRVITLAARHLAQQDLHGVVTDFVPPFVLAHLYIIWQLGGSGCHWHDNKGRFCDNSIGYCEN